MKKRIGAVVLSILILLGTVLSLAGFEYVEEPLWDGFPQNNVENTFSPAEELRGIHPEVAGAAMGQSVPTASTFSLLPGEAPFWYFDAYYVNQEDSRHVCKTKDFSLKYQFEFHTDGDLEAGSVVIRFPRALCMDRYGKEIAPMEIGVPMGRPDAFTEVSNSPFNYYVEGSDLVFFNYSRIFAGTNAAVQVLYKHIRIMDLVDQTQWQILPEIFVSRNGNTDTCPLEPLTGSIDSRAELLAFSKQAFQESFKSYTPGIYTLEQFKEYIPEVPAKYQEHFSDYVYVLWQMKATGGATQPWELYLREEPSYEHNGSLGAGELAGVQICILDEGDRVLKKICVASPVSEGPYEGQYKVSEYASDFQGRSDIRLEIYGITAYPKERAIDNETVFTNTAHLTLHPVDGRDPDGALTDKAGWTWADYHWTYKGDVIGVTKDAVQEEYPGWINLYRENRKPEAFPFFVTGSCRGYGFTHETDGPSRGQYKPGTYYEMTTADDVVYAYPLTGEMAGEKLLLSGEDYYFSDVIVKQRDQGYDIFQDQPARPLPMEDTPGIERGLTIYAMFRGQNTWEKVDEIAWDPSGELVYRFSRETLDRYPWRVKAVHNCVDYETECRIEVKLGIHGDSPVFSSMLNSQDEDLVVRLENLSAVTGKAFQPENEEGQYFQDQNTSGNLYQEKNLISLTKELYGVIAMRDCQMLTLSPLKKHAGAAKYAKAAANPSGERIEIQYTISAWEGYQLFHEKAVEELKKTSLPLPSRKQGVFYDLLPYGVQLDPSKEIQAGRLCGNSETILKNASLWDYGGITLQVDPQKDIFMNYRGTGRTLVRFHVAFQGEEPWFFDKDYFGSGFGVAFHGYCSSKDTEMVQKAPNICAYMPELGDERPLLGGVDEVVCDDGSLPPVINPQEYHYFGKDINEDGITNIPNVLYCRAMAFEDIATASQSGIEKMVRADEDRFGVFKKSAVTGRDKGYTYEINVTNIGKNPLKNLVVFDRLENAAVDRREEEKDVFASSWWHGRLKKVETVLLEEGGIKPVVYFHGDREGAPLPDGITSLPKDVLTEENGWFPASGWNRDISEVKAVAVDMSRRQDGTEFKLGNMETVTFRLSMQAPVDGEGFAYNNPSYYSLSEGNTPSEDVSQMVEGSSVRVQLEEVHTFEIRKEVTGKIPVHGQKERFSFQITYLDDQGKKLPYSSKEYTKYYKKDGSWIKEEKPQATDPSGRLYLSANEKAVFQEKAGASRLHAEELFHPFWEQKMEEKITKGVRSFRFINKYRPFLYLKKKVTGVPPEIQMEKQVFRFQIFCNGQKAAKKEYWYVDQEATYGQLPQILGSGRTDENGILSIHAGEIVGLSPGEVGDAYRVEELSDSYGEGTDWTSVRGAAEGTLNPYGNLEELENAYRWKELYLKKTLTHQKPEACTQSFSFQIWECAEKDGEAKKQLVTKGSWELLDEDRKPAKPEISGQIGENGKIQAPCAGKIIRIQGLEAGKTYEVREVDVPADYAPVNHGTTKVTMPLYASGKEAEVVNDYQRRPLKVTKVVIPDVQAGSGTGEVDPQKRFVMKLLRKDQEAYLPWTGASYRVERNGIELRRGVTDQEGAFEIGNSETAIFEALGKPGQGYRLGEVPDPLYPPVYPPKDTYAEGRLGKEGASVTMINGVSESLVFQKKYTAAPGDRQMEAALKQEGFLRDPMLQCGFSIEVYDGTSWREQELTLLCIDLVTGEAKRRTLAPGEPLLLSATETAVIQGLKKDTPYLITELSKYSHRVVKDERYTNSYINISLKDSQKGGSVTGIYGKDLYQTITNELRGFHKGNRIYKTMLAGSKTVPKGAALVYRIEKWNGTGWIPAKGIPYFVIRDPEKELSETIERTKEDGLIYVFQGEKGTPCLQFDREIRPKPHKGTRLGELRITEVPELSDKSFGYLIGFSSSGLKNATNKVPIYDLLPEDIDTFVNSNIVKEVEIEKQMKTTGKPSFIMNLVPSQVKGDQFPLPSSSLDYCLFHSETGEMIEKGKTGKDGSFSLKPGQYARFYLPDGSRWVVTESVPYPCELEKLQCSGNSTVPLSKNTAGIFLQEESYGALTREMVEIGVYDPETEKRINLTQGQVILPQRVLYAGKRINLTEIAPGAFKGCGELTSVVVPDHIHRIGEQAFLDCVRLGEITLPKGLQKLEAHALAGCTALAKVTLPEGVRELGMGALEGCEGLEQVSLPASLNTIGQRAFAGCIALRNLLLPSKVSEILSEAFRECKSLDRIELPDSVRILGANAFSKCTALTEAVLSQGMTGIPEGCFSNCTGLVKVRIPENVELLGNSAFKNCSSIREVKLPQKLTAVEDYSFEDCSRLKKIQLFGPLSTLGKRAFGNCISLEEVLLPESLTSIGYSTFENCRNLVQIQLPLGITAIGERGFYGSGLRELTIPKSITSIGRNSFGACKELVCIWIHKEEGTVPNASWGAPQNCKVYWKGTTGPIPSKIYDEEDELFYYTYSSIGSELILAAPKDRSSLKNAVIPETVNGRRVTRIGPSALENCINLTEVLLPASVTEIDARAFASCLNLSRVLLSPQLTQIGQGAFYSCSSLEELSLPDSVKNIYREAFEKCRALRRVSLPSKVTTLETDVFRDCTNMTEVIFKGEIKRVKNNVFENCYSLKQCVLPESVTSIGTGVLKDCKSLIEFRMPSKITRVSSSMFENCTALEKVVFSDAVIAIKARAFRNCKRLKTVALPKGLSTMDAMAFEGCEALDEITLPEGVSTLSQAVFKSCRNLKTLSLGRVTEISSAAFEGCIGLKELTIPSCVTAMEGDALKGCSNLEQIRIHKIENTLVGAPWMAPNKRLIVKWTPDFILEGGRVR